MRAKGTNIFEFLNSPRTQFTIPIYQRTYSWQTSHCEQLWDNILHAGRSSDTSDHFIGSVVYFGDSVFHVTGTQEIRVIDGQQRLTTVMLILEALARRLGNNEIEGLSAGYIRSTYLLNQDGKDGHHCRLQLTQTDKESMDAVVQQKELTVKMSLHIAENFKFITDKMQNLNDDGLKSFCKGIHKLTIIDMVLEQGKDKPQRIFESMNSAGRELNKSDLIRNFVLMDLDEKHQNRLYKEYWRKMEVSFGQKEYEDHFDKFMRYYLTMKTGEVPKIEMIYKEFKKYAGEPKINAKGIDELVADIHKFAGYYHAMALGSELDEKLSEAFSDLSELGVDVAYPLLLEMYDDYIGELLAHDDFEEAVRLIESYVFRRAICGRPSNAHTKIFAAFGNRLDKGKDLESANRPTTSGPIFRKKPDKDRYLESAKEHLLTLRGNQGLPRDDEFKQKFSVHLYPNDKYWLSRIENHGRKEEVNKKYTIEHIMPKRLTKTWRSSLGSNCEGIHEKYLNSPGNLTLTGYNSEYSNRPFVEKRDMEGGFKMSPLKLNKGLGALDRWDEGAIKKRAERLAKIAVEVWPFPVLPKAPPARSRAINPKVPL